jgi:ABC-2 type transport system permease protein
MIHPNSGSASIFGLDCQRQAVEVKKQVGYGFSRTVEGLRPVARLVSPFYYYDRSSPLPPGGTFDLGATILLFVVGIALAALAAWAMRARDLGGGLLRWRIRSAPATQQPSPSLLLRKPVVAGLYEHRLGLLAWALGAAIGAAFIASIGRQMVDLVNSPGGFRAYLSVIGHGDPYVAITGFLWFGVFELVLALYVITQVARWTSEDSQGRLEMIMSAPVSRTRVVVERALTLLIGTVVIITVSSVAFYIGAAAAGIKMHAGDLTIASLLLIPLGFGFAAMGAAPASWVPRQAVGVLAAVAFLSFLLTETGPLLKWPDGILKLSVFSLYGTPLTSGVDWTGLWILLAVVAVGFGAATALIQQRDVGS